MIVVVDNYDSFTFNLVQYLSPYAEVVVKRNDAPDLMLSAEKAEAIVLSPGPGRPAEAGEMAKVIETYYRLKPILGICLGHQGIAEVFGGNIKQAAAIRHGKSSLVQLLTDQEPLLANLPSTINVMRYHSLLVEQASLPPFFDILAIAMDDQTIMTIKHRDYSVYGLQFHPESIGTDQGQQLLENFVTLVKKENEVRAHE